MKQRFKLEGIHALVVVYLEKVLGGISVVAVAVMLMIYFSMRFDLLRFRLIFESKTYKHESDYEKGLFMDEW